MLSPRAALPVLLVPVAFGAGLLLAGGDEPQADAEAGSSIERIDVADRAVDVPGVTAVRVPALRAAPKAEQPAASSGAGSSSGATESATPSTGTAEPTQPTPPAGGSGSTSPSTSGSQSTPKPDSGSTSGSAEEGSTGS